MRIQIFFFNLWLLSAGVIYVTAVPTGAPKDAKQLEDLPDYDLKNIAANFSDADLARFQLVSKRFRAIGQTEFENRASYLWKKGKIIENTFLAHAGPVFKVFVLNHGRIVSVGENKRIYVWEWDGEKYKKIRLMADDVKDQLISARFSFKNNILVLCHKNNENNIINAWDVLAGGKINEFNIKEAGYTTLSL